MFYLYSFQTWYLFICNLFTLVSEIKSRTHIYSLPTNYIHKPQRYHFILTQLLFGNKLKVQNFCSQKRMIRSINLSWLYSCEQYIPKRVPLLINYSCAICCFGSIIFQLLASWAPTGSVEVWKSKLRASTLSVLDKKCCCCLLYIHQLCGENQRASMHGLF